MSYLLRQTSQYLLNNPLSTVIVVVLLACFPLTTTWLAVSIIALITLRQGAYKGGKLVIVGAAIATISEQMTQSVNLLPIAATFVMGYVTALILRVTVSWKAVMLIMLSAALLIIFIFQSYFPDAIVCQWQILMANLQQVNASASLVKLLTTPNPFQQKILLNTLLGVQVLTMVLSVLTSLALARYSQSLLFYPGGFQREWLTMKMSKLITSLVLIVVVGIYQGNAVAMSSFPLLMVYCFAAGISLFFYAMVHYDKKITLAALLLPLAIIPYLVLPGYILLGLLDSIFNFRIYLPSLDTAIRQYKE